VYDSTAKQLAFRNAAGWVNLSTPRVAEIYYDASSADSSPISLADTEVSIGYHLVQHRLSRQGQVILILSPAQIIFG
jgi:hypothetical protein